MNEKSQTAKWLEHIAGTTQNREDPKPGSKTYKWLQHELHQQAKVIGEQQEDIERLTAENERLRRLCASAGAALCHEAIDHAKDLLTKALEATE